MKEQVKSLLFGVAAGDALGVPVEFRDREYLRNHPVTEMTGYGTHHQPPGTWSDDSSLTFCLAEALTHPFDPETVGRNFVRWYREGYWAAGERLFDIGGATHEAIHRLIGGVPAAKAGGGDETANGNGSLMRIAPLVFHIADKPAKERFEITRLVSSITHAHIRSVIGCFYSLEFCLGILRGQDKFAIYQQLKEDMNRLAVDYTLPPYEIRQFGRLLQHDIFSLEEDAIESSGYVVHTLEASVWCLLTTETYSEAVLKAVNLGGDTDTTAAVTGGLAGLLYCYDAIPAHWIHQLAKKDAIAELAERLGEAISPSIP
jgi:ADP-ribosyl-[dinitrogen reductase] hydrolase